MPDRKILTALYFLQFFEYCLVLAFSTKFQRICAPEQPKVVTRNKIKSGNQQNVLYTRLACRRDLTGVTLQRRTRTFFNPQR